MKINSNNDIKTSEPAVRVHARAVHPSEMLRVCSVRACAGSMQEPDTTSESAVRVHVLAVLPSPVPHSIQPSACV